MAKSENTAIRVKASTVRRLRDHIERLCVAIELGTVEDIRDGIDAKNPATGPITFDRFIVYLLDQRDNYATARNVRKRRRAAARRRPQAMPLPPDPFVNPDGSPADG